MRRIITCAFAMTGCLLAACHDNPATITGTGSATGDYHGTISNDWIKKVAVKLKRRPGYASYYDPRGTVINFTNGRMLVDDNGFTVVYYDGESYSGQLEPEELAEFKTMLFPTLKINIPKLSDVSGHS